MSKLKISLVFLIGLALLTASSCNWLYNTGGRTSVNISPACSFETLSGCDKKNIFYSNQDQSKVLAVLEIDEQGKFINERYAEAIFNYVKTRNQQPNKPFVALFVHGWNHNDDEKDENLVSFRNALGVLQMTNAANQAKPVIGIYVTWRARIYPSFLNYVTFWNRKWVSEEVGRGDLSRFILKLDSELKTTKPDDQDKSIFVLAGHSFGASALYTAVSPVLITRFYESLDAQKKDPKTPLTGIGDFVLLLNPAIEATRFLALREAVWRGGAENPEIFKNNLKPFFMVIGSNNDNATKFAFPIGRHLNATFERYRPIEIVDGASKETKEVKERKLDLEAIGNYSPFYTHWIVQSQPESKNESETGISEKACKIISRAWLLESIKPESSQQEWRTFSKQLVLNEIFKKPTDGWLVDLSSAPRFNAHENGRLDGLGERALKANKIENEKLIKEVQNFPIRISTKFIEDPAWGGSEDDDEKHTTKYSTTWKRNPYWFIRANQYVIQGHNGIWSRPLGCFMLGIIVADNSLAESELYGSPLSLNLP